MPRGVVEITTHLGVMDRNEISRDFVAGMVFAEYVLVGTFCGD